MASAVREHREAGLCSASLPLSSQPWTLTHGRENLPTSVNSIFNTHSHGQRRVSKVMLNPVKLTRLSVTPDLFYLTPCLGTDFSFVLYSNALAALFEGF